MPLVTLSAIQGESHPGLHVSAMKIQDTFRNIGMGEGMDQWRNVPSGIQKLRKLYKASVSERGEATALPSSFASSEGPEEVSVPATHMGDCGAGRSYVAV